MIVQSSAQLNELLALLDLSDTWSYDIETTGLNVRKEQIIGFSGASDAGSFYVIHKAWNGLQLIDLISKADLEPVMQKLKTKLLVTHNGSFDTRFTHHYFDVPLWPSLHHDTQLGEHTLNENRHNYKLKEIGEFYFGETAKAEQAAMEADLVAKNADPKAEMFKADPALLAAYGRKDAELTWNLYKLQKASLEKQNLSKFFYEDEVMPLYSAVTIPMELKGINVDAQAMQSASVALAAELKDLESQIQAKIAPYLTNFNNWYIEKHYPFKLTARFKDKLAHYFDATNWPRTATGSLSFSKADLDRAVKKGLVDPNGPLYKYGTQQQRPPADLVQKIQLQLLAEDGLANPFNLLSTDHLKRLFFIEHGGPLAEKPLSKTPKGAPQINDAFLEAMALKYDWAALLQDYRSLTKLKGTYIDRILESQEAGIFYPQFHQHRTTSGRYSGDMQQLPRIKEEGEIASPLVLKYTNLIRTFFISAPAWNLVDADYEQLEVVVFADDAQDEKLLNVIRNNWDFYSLTAIEAEKLEGLSADKAAPNYLKNLKPAVRQNAKQYALGIRYGEQPYKISKVLNITESQARQIYDNYLKSFPKLALRMKQLVQEAKLHGRVKSKAGRVRRYPEMGRILSKHGSSLLDGLELWKEYHYRDENGNMVCKSTSAYERAKLDARQIKNLINNALNFPIQSMAASIVSRASIALSRTFIAQGLQAYIALSVHDELCVHCPESETDKVAGLMEQIMENTTKLSVPLRAKPIVGKCYGDVK